MRGLLKQHFGYDEFRPMQEEIVKNVMEGKDVLVLMSTGGGKSLCYQLPAIKFEGLTLVISPLISLMKDQVDGLRARGIEAEYINSSLTFEEIQEIQQKIKNKETKILYIAPERFASSNFKDFLKGIELSLIAIDEAHCISQWGHDFRQEYRNLKFLKILFPYVPVIALTATATEKVKEDILKELSLRNPKIFISSFNRENLKLSVVKKNKTFEKIVEILKKHKKESTIIYCFSRNDCENISMKLIEHGFEALPYHAGLDNKVRKNYQELFIQGKIDIIVATVAFGMGIDKSDVRLIIHQTFPKTLESYYQEIGRAGRDGFSSECILFYSAGDKRKHEIFIDEIKDEVAQQKELSQLKKVMDYCEQDSCRKKSLLEHFGETLSGNNCKSCDVCLGISKRNVFNDLAVEKKKESFNYDSSLFESLRRLRSTISQERHVPSFIIFNDSSLREMASRLPTTEEEFLEISGVGPQKLEEFGDLFLNLINRYVQGNR